MNIRKFDIEKDLVSLETFLRNQYYENKNMTSLLPERLHDLLYRMDTQYADEGKNRSRDYIFIWEDNDEIVGCILPDGDAIYVSIQNGYEGVYQSIVDYAEENCKPIFEKEEDGTIVFLVIANDSQRYRKEVLEKKGYIRQAEEDYDNDVCAYCFVYVDMQSKTALIEPVSTREKYRHKGIGTAMMQGVMLKCKELGIEKCYVNSYDWRRKFYNASGFITEDSIGFYHKRI